MVKEKMTKCIICGKKMKLKDVIIKMYRHYCKTCAPLRQGRPFDNF